MASCPFKEMNCNNCPCKNICSVHTTQVVSAAMTVRSAVGK